MNDAETRDIALATMTTVCVTWAMSKEYLSPTSMDRFEHQLVALPIPPDVIEFCEGIGDVLDSNPQKFLTALCMQLLSKGLGHFLKDLIDKHGSLGEVRKMVMEMVMEKVQP